MSLSRHHRQHPYHTSIPTTSIPTAPVPTARASPPPASLPRASLPRQHPYCARIPTMPASLPPASLPRTSGKQLEPVRYEAGTQRGQSNHQQAGVCSQGAGQRDRAATPGQGKEAAGLLRAERRLQPELWARSTPRAMAPLGPPQILPGADTAVTCPSKPPHPAAEPLPALPPSRLGLSRLKTTKLLCSWPKLPLGVAEPWGGCWHGARRAPAAKQDASPCSPGLCGTRGVGVQETRPPHTPPGPGI